MQRVKKTNPTFMTNTRANKCHWYAFLVKVFFP
jgi:hypothetical protein